MGSMKIAEEMNREGWVQLTEVHQREAAKHGEAIARWW